MLGESAILNTLQDEFEYVQHWSNNADCEQNVQHEQRTLSNALSMSLPEKPCTRVQDSTSITKKRESHYYSTGPGNLKTNPAGFLMQISQPRDLTRIAASHLGQWLII